jgi:hypothetical protein
MYCLSNLCRSNQPAHDPFSIFEAFGFGGMGGRGREEEPRTSNIEIPLRVSLRQLYVGDVLDTRYSRQVLCVEHTSCTKACKDCQGPGVKMRHQQLAPGFVQQVQVRLKIEMVLNFDFINTLCLFIGSRRHMCSSRQVLEEPMQELP